MKDLYAFEFLPNIIWVWSVSQKNLGLIVIFSLIAELKIPIIG